MQGEKKPGNKEKDNFFANEAIQKNGGPQDWG